MRTCTIIVLLALCAVGWAGDASNERDTYHLQGPVHTMRLFSTTFGPGLPPEGRTVLEWSISFDLEGFRREEIHYDLHGVETCRDLFEGYKWQVRRNLRICSDHTKDYDIENVVSQDRLWGSVTVNGLGEIHRTVESRSEDGTLVTTTYDGLDNIAHRTVETHDETAHTTHVLDYAGDRLRLDWTIWYDPTGRKVLKEVTQDDRGLHVTTRTQTLDGNTEKFTVSDGPQGLEWERQTTTAEGQLLGGETHTPTSSWRFTKKYDPSGNLIEDLMYGPEGQLQRRLTQQREFDAYGNWIRETSRVWDGRSNGAVTQDETREITYW